ncbi:MAG: hypothetical protein ACI9SJ_001566 [Flavobacteriaceae bacterium]|jgi:hypothetical protein|uniref:hypothetical protein n=1 Tax=Candidatus Marifrigoribacter sp. Uisw_064 TaxID=3230970 RepID=UPI003ADF16BA
MKKNDIDDLFNRLEGTYDIGETPLGHSNRFLNKLNSDAAISVNTEATSQKPVYFLNWKRAIAIAAVVVLMFNVGSFLFSESDSTADLASVSPEMEQTQSFFVSTLNQELQTLKSFDSPDAKFLVEDALKQIDILEKQYEGLKTDLVESGNDNRVIYAMITNFQNRIELLQEVILKIEEIKDLNTTQNENII